MNLYILDRTPLNALGRLSEPPSSGDVVVFLRPGQDPDGARANRLAGKGIRTAWGESLLDREDSLETDRLGMEFLNRWYWENGTDVTRTGDVSFGKLLDWEIGRLVNPAFMVRTGEIIRLALETFPEAETVYCDLADGEGVDRTKPSFRPLSRLAEHVVTSRGRVFRRLESVDPLPPLIIRKYEISFARILKSYLGGFRPAWLKAKLGWFSSRGKKTGKPVVYVFLGRGTELLVNRLLGNRNLRLVVNRTGIEGAGSLRYDHLLAFPVPAELKTARKTIRHAESLSRSTNPNSDFRLNGISYGPILAGAAATVIKSLIWKNLIVMAQARKLQNKVDFDGLVINGEAGFLMGALSDMNRDTGKAIYYVGHGMNTSLSNSVGTGFNSPHVTYIACGKDHQAEYGIHLPESQKPRRPALGNPLTTLMNPVRGKRSHRHGKRLLILGSGFSSYASASRIRSCERHLADAFMAVRLLTEEGWTATYRGHPHHSQLLEKRIARDLGVDEFIQWDRHPDISPSLLRHDVVVTALSSVYYQSLYAGWPTIYYDPMFLDGDTPETHFPEYLFVGLPAARDIEWPVATDREGLVRLLRDSLDPHSLTATFPGLFAGVYAERFIGPRAHAADAEIADFIAADLVGGASDSPAKPRPIRETPNAEEPKLAAGNPG